MWGPTRLPSMAAATGRDYRFEMDSRTGGFTGKKLVAETPNPSSIAIHPSKKYLYSVNEVINQESGSVSAFAIDSASGDLTPLNSIRSRAGDRPT